MKKAISVKQDVQLKIPVNYELIFKKDLQQEKGSFTLK